MLEGLEHLLLIAGVISGLMFFITIDNGGSMQHAKVLSLVWGFFKLGVRMLNSLLFDRD
jgi:hypothetical protein